jgi:hypothetical protein
MIHARARANIGSSAEWLFPSPLWREDRGGGRTTGRATTGNGSCMGGDLTPRPVVPTRRAPPLSPPHKGEGKSHAAEPLRTAAGARKER